MSIREPDREEKPPSEATILVSGRFLDYVVRDGWEYVARKGISGIVGIIAVTDHGSIVLVEQYRPPVLRRVLELPAGLVGDAPEGEGENTEAGAARELREETGWEASRWDIVAHGCTSPGTTSEEITLLLATGLRRTGRGGGGPGEDITVHEVPLDSAHDWLVRKEQEGVMVDLKVYGGLYLARLRGPRDVRHLRDSRLDRPSSGEYTPPSA